MPEVHSGGSKQSFGVNRMAVLYTPHFIQFLDDEGTPLAGGKLYTYAAGTVTPKATYTTAAGDIENDNPVELDSEGRAVIFLDGSYKFALTDADDVPVGPNGGVTDNVTSFATGSGGGGSSGFGEEASVAADTTTNLGEQSSHVILITGTTTITSFGSSADVADPIYFIRFSGALTLTHNATSLILPSGSNISTSNGDTATVQYLDSGNWKVLAYNHINTVLSGKSAISSSANLNTIITPGVYALSGSSYTNAPVSGTFTGSLEVRGRAGVSSSQVVQTAYRMSNLAGARMYQRTTNDSGTTWTEWQVLNGETLIATSTPTGVATVDFTSIPQRYSALVLSFSGISNETTTRSLRITTNAGAGLGSETHMAHQIAGTTVSSIVGGSYLWTPSTQTNAQVAYGSIVFTGYQAGCVTSYRGYVSLADGNSVVSFQGVIGAAASPNTGALEGLRLDWSSTGNFDAGTINLYGVN